MTPTGDDSWRSVAVAKGRSFTAVIEVTERAPDELFAFVVSDQTGRWRHEFVLEDVPGGSPVTRRITPLDLTLGQRLLYVVTRTPIKQHTLRASLERLPVEVG